MKDERQLQANGEIDNELIPAAAPTARAAGGRNPEKQIAAVACMFLVIAALLYFFLPAILPNILVGSEDKGVHIPAYEMPAFAATGTEADTIAFFVYKGSIYTRMQWRREDIPIDESLLEERLGTLKGSIDEWSGQDGYATEFASNIQGDVYSVKGYDTQFRLCVRDEYADEDNGNAVVEVSFFENLNNLTLLNGKDLFGDRLQMPGNWDHVEFQEHHNWNEGWPDFVYQDISLAEYEIDVFIQELYSGEFEYAYEAYSDMNNGTNPAVEQVHLFFHMKDGTVVELRLFEGGYVEYQPLEWYFVKMPGEAFDRVFNACR